MKYREASCRNQLIGYDVGTLTAGKDNADPMELNDRQLLEIYKLAIEQSVVGVLLLDSSGRIHWVNDRLCELLGYSREELTTLRIQEIDPTVSTKRVAELFTTTYDRDRISFDSVFRNKDGITFPVEITNNYLEFQGKRLSCTFAWDISKRKQAEAALAKSEQMLRAILNNHFQLTGLLSTDGRLLMANETALTLTGLKEDEVIGRYFWDTLWWNHSPALQKKLKAAINRAAQGEFVRFETTHPGADGTPRHVDFSLSPMHLEGRETVDFIVPEGRDITDIKQAQQALQDALQEVRQLKDRLQDENLYLQEEIKIEHNFNDIIGKSKFYRIMLGQIEQVASTEASVLILGESGTGKELVARAVHKLSPRGNRTLVKVNCAALPANLIESELFGHEKGAFTGALTRKIGRFELADEGTIFLDEIGELPLELQAKLLRVLQDGEFERLGNPKTVTVDVRVIAATNRDLQRQMRDGQFREDLFYRLNVFPILCPPLRERREDIPVLVRHFIEKHSNRIGKRIDRVPQKVMDALTAYSWPGNVRELENIVERALIVSRGNDLEIGPWLDKEPAEMGSVPLLPLKENERRHILKALEATGWRVSGERGAARILEINAQTLVSRMKRLGIERPT